MNILQILNPPIQPNNPELAISQQIMNQERSNSNRHKIKKYILKKSKNSRFFARQKSQLNQSIQMFKCDCTKIIVADDNLFNLYSFGIFIEQQGRRLKKVDSGAALLEELRNSTNCSNTPCSKYLLILADYNMEQGLNGVETFRRIRQEKLHLKGSKPSVLIGTSASEDVRQVFLQQGADDFLLKPFNQPRVKALFENYLEDRE